ncbi:hypothetical protein BKA69DRAFT_697531 [Paraphysoderma sedebokerense]|nr:hypothetical protein BKA69DRAFT_697531 [Paraphysoderma sedebokerense]
MLTIVARYLYQNCLCVDDFRIQSIVYRLFAQIIMVDDVSAGFSALIDYRNGYFLAPVLSSLKHQEPLMRISTLTFLDAILGSPDGFPWITTQEDILLEIVRCLHDSSQFVVQCASVFLSKYLGNPGRSKTCDIAFQILLSTNLSSSLHHLHGSESPLERLSFLEFVWSILQVDISETDIIQLPELISKTVGLLYDSNKLVRSMSSQIISTVLSGNVSNFFDLTNASPVYLYHHVVSPLLLHLQPEIAATGLRCFSALIRSRHLSQRDARFLISMTLHLASTAFDVKFDGIQYFNDTQYESEIYDFEMWKQRFESSGFHLIFRRKPNREIQTCVVSTIETLVMTRTLSDNEFLTLGDLLSLLLHKNHNYATFTHIMSIIQHMLQQLSEVKYDVQTAFFKNVSSFL